MVALYDGYKWDQSVKPSDVMLVSPSNPLLHRTTQTLVRTYPSISIRSPYSQAGPEIVPVHCRFFCKITGTEDTNALLMLHSIEQVAPRYALSMVGSTLQIPVSEEIVFPTHCYVNEQGNTAYINYNNFIFDQEIQVMCNTYELQDMVGPEFFGHHVACAIKELNTRALHRVPRVKNMRCDDILFKLVELAGSLSFRDNELMNEILDVSEKTQFWIDLSEEKFERFAQFPKDACAVVQSLGINVMLQKNTGSMRNVLSRVYST
jgi:hypothetical protein